MDPELLSAASRLYATSPELLTPLFGGFSNAVYKFPMGDKAGTLRIGVEDCPPDQKLGMLKLVHFLAGHGAPVAAPLFSTHQHLKETLEHDGKRYTVTACEHIDGILAERIPPDEWSEALFNNIGRAAGKLHAVSKGYQPSNASQCPPEWFESDEIREARDLLLNSPDPARQRLEDLLTELLRLPTEPPDYGIIHDDLHFANFLVRPDGDITIIDFDDCEYGWYAIDVAMALFDVLVLYNATSETESQQFAVRFMTSYLAGYRLENDISPEWMRQIPRFIKLKELCIYATLIGHPEADKPGTWVGNFMRGRAERVANDIPYIDIDFAGL
jgi:amicoumacin kinase